MNEITREFADSLTKLVDAKELLERIHLEVGPYGTGEVSEKSLNEMNDLFEFDDSE
jgi:hypothetical protein